MPKMKVARKFWWKVALAAVVLSALLVLAGVFFPTFLLCVESGPTKADCIVVLGGETFKRG